VIYMSIGGLRLSLRWLRIYNTSGFISYSLETKTLETFYLIKLTKLYKWG
jgi:hypothetical protein